MNTRVAGALASRRHRPGAAAIAYTHAMAICGTATVAESVASASLRRGAHSRLAVIAHARHQALEHARRSPNPADDGVAGTDLLTIANQLAATRPVSERSIVDLELRYSLDLSSFARVLGLTTTRAQERTGAIARTWAEQLDPAVMAWLGPGACDDLSQVLTDHRLWPRSAETPVISSIDTTGPVPLLSTGTDNSDFVSDVQPAKAVAALTVGALLGAAPAVLEHARQCDVCGERLRQMTPVRTMIGQRSMLAVPETVTEAARSAHRRIPTALPPSIEPHRIDISRLRTPTFAIIGIIACVGVITVMVTSGGNDEPSQDERVAKLLQANPSNLLATPSIVVDSTRTASLANNGSGTIAWTASADVPWLKLDPSSGRLPATKTVSIGIKSTEPAGSHADAVITITGDDGSKQTLRYRSTH